MQCMAHGSPAWVTTVGTYWVQVQVGSWVVNTWPVPMWVTHRYPHLSKPMLWVHTWYITDSHLSHSSEMCSVLHNNKLYSCYKHVQTLKYDQKKSPFWHNPPQCPQWNPPSIQVNGSQRWPNVLKLPMMSNPMGWRNVKMTMEVAMCQRRAASTPRSIMMGILPRKYWLLLKDPNRAGKQQSRRCLMMMMDSLANGVMTIMNHVPHRKHPTASHMLKINQVCYNKVMHIPCSHIVN